MAKTNKKSKGPVMFSGADADALKKEMDSGGTSYDPDMVGLGGDGDQMTVTFVSPVKDMKGFLRHWTGKNYRMCTGDGCMWCDDGDRPQKVVVTPVYVHKLYLSETDKRKAIRKKDDGYKYFIMNKKTTEQLMRIAKRRKNNLSDRLFVIERSGTGTDTEYDIERLDIKASPKIVKGWKGDVEKKIRDIFKSEQKDTKKSRVVDDDDDDDLMDDDDFFDKFDMPKSKKKKRRK